MLPAIKAFLQTHEVAEMFDLKVSTLYNWIRYRKIPDPGRDPVNGYRMWSEEHVQAIRDYLTVRTLRRNA